MTVENRSRVQRALEKLVSSQVLDFLVVYSRLKEGRILLRSSGDLRVLGSRQTLQRSPVTEYWPTGYQLRGLVIRRVNPLTVFVYSYRKSKTRTPEKDHYDGDERRSFHNRGHRKSHGSRPHLSRGDTRPVRRELLSGRCLPTEQTLVRLLFR